MEKLKVSELLEYWKEKYLETKLDKIIKEEILKKTVYKKSIFSSILKYTSVLASFLVVIFIWYFFLNIEKASPDLSVIENENNSIVEEINQKALNKKSNVELNSTFEDIQSNDSFKKELINKNTIIKDNIATIQNKTENIENNKSLWWFAIQRSTSLWVSWVEIWNNKKDYKYFLVGIVLFILIVIILLVLIRKKEKK